MRNWISLKGTGIIFLLAILASLPVWVRSEYWVHICIVIFIYTVLAVSLRLIYSTGHLSFAHSVFYGVGAYTCTLMVKDLGLNWWLSWIAGGILAALVAVVIGLPCFRAKGLYFAIVTFGFSYIFQLLLIRFASLTGGPQGIRAIPGPGSLGPLDITSRTGYYYLGLVLVTITVFVMYRIDTSRISRVFAAIEQSDTLARSIGINVTRYNLLAFTIACGFAGLAGGFFASYNTFIFPGSFSFWVTANTLIYLMVGGAQHIAGPVIGTAVLVIIPEFLRAAEIFRTLLYAILLVLMMLFQPSGFIGLFQRFSFRPKPMLRRLLRWSGG